jgi:hypothetical protein
MRGEPPDPPSADDNSSGGKTNGLQGDVADQSPTDGDTSSSDQPPVKPKMDSPASDSV